MSPPSIAPTVGEIAKRLGEPLHRVEYVIRSRHVRPASRAGNVRVFAEPDVAFVAEQLRLIAARQKPVAGGTAGEGAS